MSCVKLREQAKILTYYEDENEPLWSGWKELGEGDFPTAIDAIRFAESEVGVPWIVTDLAGTRILAYGDAYGERPPLNGELIGLRGVTSNHGAQLTFHQFRAKGVWCDDLARDMGEDWGGEVVPGRLYQKHLYIVLDGDDWMLELHGRCWHSRKLVDLEKILYAFAVREGYCVLE
jgi:hypothetical protein